MEIKFIVTRDPCTTNNTVIVPELLVSRAGIKNQYALYTDYIKRNLVYFHQVSHILLRPLYSHAKLIANFVQYLPLADFGSWLVVYQRCGSQW